jgi:hypothetical protein
MQQQGLEKQDHARGGQRQVCGRYRRLDTGGQIVHGRRDAEQHQEQGNLRLEERGQELWRDADNVTQRGCPGTSGSDDEDRQWVTLGQAIDDDRLSFDWTAQLRGR